MMGTGTPGPGVIAATGRRAAGHTVTVTVSPTTGDRAEPESRAASLSVARRACAGTGPSLRDFHCALGWPGGLPSRREALSHPSVSEWPAGTLCNNCF
jgi:hypothetical protein